MALPLAAISAIVPSLVKGGAVLYQGRQAKKLRDQYPRPKYKIPGELGEVAAASRLSYNDPNLYARNIAARQLDASIANGSRRAMDAGKGANEVLATIAALNTNQNRSLENLSVEGDMARDQRFGAMSNALGNMAGARDQAYYENQKEPYEHAQNAASALSGAAIQNAYGAVSDFADFGSKTFPLKGNIFSLPTKNRERGTIPSQGPSMTNESLMNVLTRAAGGFAGGIGPTGKKRRK